MNVDIVIQQDWCSEPSMRQACLNVWQILSAREYQLDHYTFAELAQLIGGDDESLISNALLYLANPKVKVLKTCLMYEYDGKFIELPEEEVTHYARGEAVIHPEFGVPMPEYEILLCFAPGDRLQEKGSA